MAGISVPGIGSGLDVDGMSFGLAQAEMSGQINFATKAQQKVNGKISSLGNIMAGLTSFKSTLANMNASSLTANQLNYPSEDKVINITPTGNAINGDYDITVSSLASSHALKSVQFDDDAVFSGSMSISTGTNNYSVSIEENSSIYSLANQINNDLSGVSAVVINNGTGNVLSVSSKESGSDNNIQINASADSSANSMIESLIYNETQQSMIETKAASNANININGVNIVSNDNDFNSAVKGLDISINPNIDLDLLDTTQHFDITKDSSDLVTTVKTFKNHLNAILSGLKDVQNYNQETNTASVFSGDNDIRSLTQQLKTIIASSVETNSKYNTLYSIGFSTNLDGTVNLDTSTLDSAISDDSDSVIKLISGGLSSTNSSFTIDTEMEDTIPAFSQEIMINEIPKPASTSLTTTLFTNPLSTPITLSQGFDLSFNGNLIATLLGSGGDSMEFSNYPDFISQINADLLTQNTPITASLKTLSSVINNPAYTSGGSEPLTITQYVSDILFEQNIISDGSISLNINGNASFTETNVIAAQNGTLTYDDNTYDFISSFTTPDTGIEISINTSAIEENDSGMVASSKGYAFLLTNLVNSFMEDDGILDNKSEALKDSKTRYSDKIDSLRDKQDKIEQRYLREFRALDIALSSMKQQSNALTAQLKQISSINNSD